MNVNSALAGLKETPKVTIEVCGIRCQVENLHGADDIKDVMELVAYALVGVGFHPNTVRDVIAEGVIDG